MKARFFVLDSVGSPFLVEDVAIEGWVLGLFCVSHLVYWVLQKVHHARANASASTAAITTFFRVHLRMCIFGTFLSNSAHFQGLNVGDLFPIILFNFLQFCIILGLGSSILSPTDLTNLHGLP